MRAPPAFGPPAGGARGHAGPHGDGAAAGVHGQGHQAARQLHVDDQAVQRWAQGLAVQPGGRPLRWRTCPALALAQTTAPAWLAPPCPPRFPAWWGAALPPLQPAPAAGTLKLGEVTSSYDSETEVLESQPWEHISDEQIKAAASALTGDILQVPPMYSAIKLGGGRPGWAGQRREDVRARPAHSAHASWHAHGLGPPF
jgi:hypothetical protein